jgi:hypothetical protein
MDELGRGGGRPAGKVAFLEKGDGEAASCSIARNTRAINAATDDDEVEIGRHRSPP